MMEPTRVLVFLLALIYVSNALSQVEITKAKQEEEIALRQIYTTMDTDLKNLIRDHFKTVLGQLQEIMPEYNVSTKCNGNILKILLGVRDFKQWAATFIDATAKLNDGVLGGNINMFGNYDQCLNSSAFKKDGSTDFRGQYCLVSMATYLPSTELTPVIKERIDLVKNLTQNLTEAIRIYALKSELVRSVTGDKIGLCVPSGCDLNDVNQFLKYATKKVHLNLTLDYCDTEDTLIQFTFTRIIILCIIAIFVLFVIISSVVERYSVIKGIQYKNPVMRCFLCFSVPHNFQKYTNTNVGTRNLRFLNGIKVITLFWVILGHHYSVKVVTLMSRNHVSVGYFTWTPTLSFQLLLNAILSVDVFFFIGGFLNCYIRAHKNLTFFSIKSSFLFIIHRMFRLHPVVIACILLNLLMYQRGPMAHVVQEKFFEPCKYDWWKNLLFINNLFPVDIQCIGHTWYLSADTQLFLVSLVTVPVLFRNQKLGVLLNLTVILLALSATFAHAYVKEIIPSLVADLDRNEQDFRNYIQTYFSPVCHAASYFGGILLGYFIVTGKNFKMSKKTQIFGWIVASTLFLTMLFVTKRWNSGSPVYRLDGALYFTLSRPLFSWSVGWLIFCCFAGHGGIINYILSWRIWIPLSRLCLSAYLLSLILQVHYFGNLRFPQDLQTEVEIWGFIGDAVVTCLFAVPMVLTLESPFIALEKILFHSFFKEQNTSEIKETEMNCKEIIQHENDEKNENNKNSIIIVHGNDEKNENNKNSMIIVHENDEKNENNKNSIKI